MVAICAYQRECSLAALLLIGQRQGSQQHFHDDGRPTGGLAPPEEREFQTAALVITIRCFTSTIDLQALHTKPLENESKGGYGGRLVLPTRLHRRVHTTPSGAKLWFIIEVISKCKTKYWSRNVYQINQRWYRAKNVTYMYTQYPVRPLKASL